MNLRFSHQCSICPSQWLDLPCISEEKITRSLDGTDKDKEINSQRSHPSKTKFDEEEAT